MELKSYDAWKTREPEIEHGRPHGYRCASVGCKWKGLAIDAYEHHTKTHHPIELINGVRAQFSCCPEKGKS